MPGNNKAESGACRYTSASLELDFFLGRITAHGLMQKEFFQPWLFLNMTSLPFDKLKFPYIIPNQSPIQNHFNPESSQNAIPAFDQSNHKSLKILLAHVKS